MRRRLFGRHPLTIGALILLGLSVYEFWVRFEDFRAWFLGVKHLSEVRGTSFIEDLFIIFEVPEMQQMGFKMLYLLAVVIFAVICLICRNRAKFMWTIFLLAIAAGVTGIMLEFYSLTSWLQAIKLIPLALIAYGSISNQINCRKPMYVREDIPERIQQRAGEEPERIPQRPGEYLEKK